MELNSRHLNSVGQAVRKKRSQPSRKPRPESRSLRECSEASSTSPSDDAASKGSHEDNISINTSSKQRISKVLSVPEPESRQSLKRSHKDGDSGRSVPNNGASQSSADGIGNGNKVKKVKLNVRGVTHTLHAKNSANGAPGSGISRRSSSVDDIAEWPKENQRESHLPRDKRSTLQGIPWADFSKGGFNLGKGDSSMGRPSGKNNSAKHGDMSASVRKSKRTSKKSAMDEESDDSDQEIRYLEKLKISKSAARYREDGEEGSKKQRLLSKISNTESSSSRSVRDGRKARSEKSSEDTDYEVDEELALESELEGKNQEKQKKGSAESSMDARREMTLTTRQRALQSGKDVPGSSLIEFPNGLPPAAPRRQKEKLSEVELQLKKAEVAQRRRLQVEKAARESEAEAIRKILGQDSSRKKREEKMKKRQEELAQEKAANALKVPPNTIRTTMGPTGTVVTFAEEMGLPRIFNPKPTSYPPPREKCAGPNCTNPYKYRDSKSSLPLCSLVCYKAVQTQSQAENCN